MMYEIMTWWQSDLCCCPMPHSKKVHGPGQAQPIHVEFTCSLHAWEGFLRVLLSDLKTQRAQPAVILIMAKI